MLVLLPILILLVAWLTCPAQQLTVECSPALVSGVPLQRVGLIGTSEVFFDQLHGHCQVFMFPVS